MAEATVPLRQRGRRHAHALRRADHGGLARVSYLLFVKDILLVHFNLMRTTIVAAPT